MPADAATATFQGSGTTGPNGMVFVGTHLWVSQPVTGFCRLDADPITGKLSPNAASCDTSTKQPGQPSFDPVNNFVFLPDLGSKSQGVIRLTFNPTTNTVSTPVVVAPLPTNIRPTATVLDSAGNLYVGSDRSPNIWRVTNASGATPGTPTVIGTTPDGVGTVGLAIAGTSLFIAETSSVSKMPLTGGTATVTAVKIPGPFSIVSDGTLVYLGDEANVFRFNPANDQQDVLDGTGTGLAATPTSFTFITGLALDSTGTLWIGDDPTAGSDIRLGQGRVWSLATPAIATADIAGSPGVQATPPPASPTVLTPAQVPLFARGNITAPAGGLFMGTHVWISDLLNGFCRLDPNPATPGISFENVTTCSTAATTPSQPAFDPLNNFVYIPELHSNGAGVFRLVFDPATETLSSPVLIANMPNSRLTSAVLGPDGALYVGGVASPHIFKITNPDTATPGAPVAIGTTSDLAGVFQLVFVGNNLYVGESLHVSLIANAAVCTSCTAAVVASETTVGPASLATDGQNILYVGETDSITRYTISTGTMETYADTGSGLTVTPPPPLLRFVFALVPTPAGDLYAADDPGGDIANLGRVWKITGAFTPPGALAAPTITGTVPASPNASLTPAVQGTAPAGSVVTVYTNANCTAPGAATGSAAQFATPGLTVTVPAGGTTSISAKAADTSGHVSGCSAPITYTNLATAGPVVTITGNPASPTNNPNPTFTFAATPALGVTFQCSMSTGADAFAPCTSPKTYTGLASGAYTFKVFGTNAGGTSGVPATAALLIDTIPPVATPPTKALAAVPLGLTTAHLQVTWSATDNLTGIARYQLQQSVGGRAFTTVTLPAPTTAAVVLARAASSYDFRVAATDGAGNVGAFATAVPFTLSIPQENNAAIHYVGTWTRLRVAGASGGSVKFANAANATAAFTFTGTSVQWVTCVNHNRGIAQVLLDGVSMGTVDLFAPAFASKQIGFTANALAPGAHTLTIRVTGTKNPVSTGTRVDVDAFVVLR